jgi:CRP/FNR family cyclic AMP-dependent transcriptional regulator
MSDFRKTLKDLPLREFAPGERMMAEGEQHPSLLFLESGKVEVVRGGQRIAVIKVPGSVLGEMSFLLDQPATADVVAMEPTACRVAEDPLPFLRSHPEVTLEVATGLAMRLDAAARYLVDVKDQMSGISDHVGMVDSVLDKIVHRDLKRRAQ